MNAEQARSTRFLLWCALLLLALRPVAPVDEAVRWAVAPLRVVAELAAPLRLFERRSLLAAERELAATAIEEEEASVRLKRDLQRGAEPSDPRLRAGRTLVGGEVRGRDPEHDDRVLVRLPSIRGIVRGLPVVSGDAYVGRVLSVVADAAPDPDGADARSGWGTAVVELVTAGGFHVGASIAGVGAGGAPVYCTVGGLHVSSGTSARNEDARHLELHNPSDRKLIGGVARVDELFDDDETFAELSRGFVLGDVERIEDGGWRVVPQLDYEDGLVQVVILLPADAFEGVPLSPELQSDARWLVARPLVAAVPTPWRSAAVVDRGSLAGVRVGAAVTAVGQRLVGRIDDVTPTTARVAFVSDPGFQVVAVARVDSLAEPLVLGRLVSMGREPATGDVLLRWVARVETALAEAESDVPARLFTGSGDPGLETGFFLGDAILPPRSDGPRIVRLRTDVPPHKLRRMYIRTDAQPGDEAAAAGGGG